MSNKIIYLGWEPTTYSNDEFLVIFGKFSIDGEDFRTESVRYPRSLLADANFSFTEAIRIHTQNVALNYLKEKSKSEN